VKEQSERQSRSGEKERPYLKERTRFTKEETFRADFEKTREEKEKDIRTGGEQINKRTPHLLGKKYFLSAEGA